MFFFSGNDTIAEWFLTGTLLFSRNQELNFLLHDQALPQPRVTAPPIQHLKAFF
jgi:hypothetical protein